MKNEKIRNAIKIFNVGMIILFVLLALLTYYNHEFVDKNNQFFVFLALFLSILGTSLSIWLFEYFKSRVLKPIEALYQAAQMIDRGKFDTQVVVKHLDEIGVLSNYLNLISKNLLAIRNQILAQNTELKTKIQEINAKNLELEEREWILEGIAQFAAALQYKEKDIEKVCYTILSNVISYIGASQGALFTVNNTQSSFVLDMTAQYGFDAEQKKNKKFRLGEGLVGVCAKNREIIYIENFTTEDTIFIETGTSLIPVRSLLLIPLLANKELRGVLEILSLEKIGQHKKQLLTQISENIGLTLENIKSDLRTEELLHQLKISNEEFKSQGEELRQNTEELIAINDSLERMVEIRTIEVMKQKEIIEKKNEEILERLKEQQQDKEKIERAYQQLKLQEEAMQQNMTELREINDQMERAQRELEYHKSNLEEIVTSRTKQLQIAQEELIVAKEQAEYANEAKTQFLTDMSHEIRSPLNAIVGFSQILSLESQRMNLPQEFKYSLDNIKLSGDNLSELINNILDLSKIESGKIDFTSEVLNLKQLFKGIFHINKANASEKEVDLQYDFDPEVPEIVETDRTKINQILMNLTNNAIKFTPGGKKVTIQAFKEKEWTVFEVQDQGIGIAPERLESIFDPFIQADSSISKVYGGTGLGLTITKKMVELMGGSIDVESTLGVGTTFRVKLKIPEASANFQAPKEIRWEDYSFSHENIVLIAEDNQLNQEMMAHFFNQINIQPIFAEDGKSCIEMIQKLNPDLVLMDIHMPILDGIETTRQIREIEGFETLPIIAISANAFLKQQAKALEAGMQHFLPKPLNFQKLLPLLEKYLKRDHSTARVPVKKEDEITSEAVTNNYRSKLNHRVEILHSIPFFNGEKLIKVINEIRRSETPDPVLSILNKMENAIYDGNENHYLELLNDMKEI